MMPIFVVYMGGTCGDLVTSVIDNQTNTLNTSKMNMQVIRSLLKKPHIFRDNEEKIQYINEVTTLYKSLPSHDVEFHKEQKHDFLGIAVETEELALWAAIRFKKLHRELVWEQICKWHNINKVEDYATMLLNYSSGVIRPATNKIITLEEIVNGKLIESLHNYGINETDESLYKNWLKAQDK